MMEKWIAFNDPFFTDREPYCNRVSYMTEDDAVSYFRRTHPDANVSDEEALLSFMATHWAWRVPAPNTVDVEHAR